MKKKNWYWIIGIIFILLIILILGLRGFNGGEDNWIKDSRGVYIKHGNPAETPNYVNEQQIIIGCAAGLYMSMSDTEFNSQCLGRCQDYSVDIVHVPRTAEDNLEENQCQDYKNGVTKHFIELDKDGNIVRIV